MELGITHILLNLIGALLIIKWFKQQYVDYKTIQKKLTYFSFKRFRNILFVSFLSLTPILVINYTAIEETYHLAQNGVVSNSYYYAIIISFFISLVWLIYILKLDIFNKEKKRHLLLIFVLAVFFTLMTQIPYDFIHSIGFKDTAHPLKSFLYSVFGIGLIEESIKLIPLLLVLKFTKAIDEPYDFVLYASVSALGFAFIENAMYLHNYGLEISNARALYATVAHMTFSSIVAYGLFLNRFNKTKRSPFLVFILFFFLAIFSHGFYDFWLMNKTASQFSGITTIFLLLLIHVWFSIKNNTINASNFYSENKKINNDYLQLYLTFGLLSIFMFSYIYVALRTDSSRANEFFVDALFIYGYLIFYLIATLTKYNLVEGLLNPIKVRIRNIIPKKRN